jgi:hypothetical protein
MSCFPLAVFGRFCSCQTDCETILLACNILLRLYIKFNLQLYLFIYLVIYLWFIYEGILSFLFYFLLTRAVRKVTSHFEYLQNRSLGLDVTR